jgi:8-oxo-dGTP pyrophosphatase MutT (NUDIX family)
MAAGALFVDEQQRVLLVKPTYKSYWEIPGGYIEPGESPYTACVREVEEELGIQPPIGELLIVDWAPHPQQGDKLLFIFNGNRLDTQQLAAIQLQESELSEYRYVPESDISHLTIPRLARRIKQALEAREAGNTSYLEHGTQRP